MHAACNLPRGSPVAQTRCTQESRRRHDPATSNHQDLDARGRVNDVRETGTPDGKKGEDCASGSR